MKKILLFVLPILAVCIASCKKDKVNDDEIIQFKDPNFLKELLVVKDFQVNVPDVGTKQVHQDIDKNQDGQISIGEAKQVMHLEFGDEENGCNLTDINEIRYFTALESLVCTRSKISSLDVSNNTALEILQLYGHKLTSLDVSKNKSLIWLTCDNPHEGAFFPEGENIKADGLLTSLNISENSALRILSCGGNLLTSLDLSKNPELVHLSCNVNKLTSIDVTNNKKLEELYCACNQLATLDVSQNTEMFFLYCCSNQLTTLDLSKNTALTNLYCVSNPLTKVTLRRDNDIYENDIRNLQDKCGDIIEYVD